MTRLVNVTCQDMAVNMRHVHDKVNWRMCQDTVTHMKHAHDKAGNCYTCQDVVVMYMGHVHDESGYIAVMDNETGNCHTCAHAYRMCYAYGTWPGESW